MCFSVSCVCILTLNRHVTAHTAWPTRMHAGRQSEVAQPSLNHFDILGMSFYIPVLHLSRKFREICVLFPRCIGRIKCASR